jgi:hypothetical protein
VGLTFGTHLKTSRQHFVGCQKGNVHAKLPFMTRLPKKRGITQDGEDKSLTTHLRK